VTGSARNIQFELEMAALLFQERINNLRFDSRHDLVCSLYHNPLIVECKRPRKNRTLGDAYAEGAHQIDSSSLVAENPNTKGIVALDLTQIVFPTLAGSRFSSMKEMEKAFVRAFINAWRGLQITISDYGDRVSALHLFSRAPWYLEIAGSFVSVPAKHNLVVINTRDYERNQKIANTYADFLKRISNLSFPPQMRESVG
jgi:hypothetical protein